MKQLLLLLNLMLVTASSTYCGKKSPRIIGYPGMGKETPKQQRAVQNAWNEAEQKGKSWEERVKAARKASKVWRKLIHKKQKKEKGK